jgi:hypothetical protein
VRAVTVRESEWTDEDRGWLLAYLEDKKSRCGGCGNYLDECRDPKTAGKWRVVHQQCEACRIGEADAENRAEAPARQRGVYAAVVLGS